MRKALLWILPFMFLLAGCDTNRVIVNGLAEREANEIVVFLASQKINAEKVAAKSSGGIGGDSAVTLWNISVAEKNMTYAMSILNQNGLPRKKGTNLLELFAKQGLMTSEKEETIRYQAGLEQQIANTIRKIDGVIDADVQLSFPQETTGTAQTVTLQRTTAAVYVKHQGIVDDPNSHLVSKIKRLVSGSVNGLDINDVTIISDKSRFTDITLSSSSEEITSSSKELTSIWSIILSQHSVLRFRLLFLSLIVSNFFFLFLSVWMAWKVYPILSRKGGITSLFSQEQVTLPEEIVSLE
ncbi:type III secretion system inner membrane ring lipoprotein SctJ [Rhabdochlamydiaceae symbiont of Dictyostelium giganteum]|uniref:type III secretion system inner membrane ring lipoprotein SctJ n=1 Tax=Rhabdochlamydiaceae symbiont of Dictyostelium giganteum TaxID=3342349 RepID=UPI00384C512C